MKNILVMAVFLVSTNVYASDSEEPSSYSECILKYIAGDSISEVVEIIKAACKDQFPGKLKKAPIRTNDRCIAIKEQLTQWDDYMSKNFSSKALRKQRNDTFIKAMALGGPRGVAKAEQRLEDNIRRNKRDALGKRQKVLDMSVRADC